MPHFLLFILCLAHRLMQSHPCSSLLIRSEDLSLLDTHTYTVSWDFYPAVCKTHCQSQLQQSITLCVCVCGCVCLSLHVNVCAGVHWILFTVYSESVQGVVPARSFAHTFCCVLTCVGVFVRIHTRAGIYVFAV